MARWFKASWKIRIIAGTVIFTIILNPISQYIFTAKHSIYADIVNVALNRVLPTKNFPIESKSADSILLKGLRYEADNPLTMTFYFDTMNSNQAKQKDLKRLINYFLGFLATPSAKLWVNLSPYEKERVTPDVMSRQDTGKDMLLEDYLLKQLSGALTNPKTPTGKKFWKEVYKAAQRISGSNKVPINSCYKVWVVPDVAEVYEYTNQNEKSKIRNNNVVGEGLVSSRNKTVAFVKDARLKVMMETDYYNNVKQQGKGLNKNNMARKINQEAAEIFKRELLPVIEEQVNESITFAPLRQMYYALILASYFKRRLGHISAYKSCVNQEKIEPIELSGIKGDKLKQAVFNSYVRSFKEGAYDVISRSGGKEAGLSGTRIKRAYRYFSGGLELGETEKVLNIKIGQYNSFQGLCVEVKNYFGKKQDKVKIKGVVNQILSLITRGIVGLIRVYETRKVVLDLLEKLKNKDDADVRSMTADALGRIGPAAKATVLALIAALEDDNSFVRRRAAEALGRIGPEAEEVVPALIAALKDDNYSVRGMAAEALGRIGPEAKAAVPDLITALEDDNSFVRRRAAEALGRIGPAAKAAVPALIAALKDKDTDVRSMTAEALLKIDKSLEDKKIFIEKFREKYMDTLQAFVYIGNNQWNEVVLLGQSAVPALIAALEDKNINVRRAAAEALGKIGPEAKAAVLELILALKNDNYFVRRAAAEALGRIGPEAKAAVPDLILALTDDDASVRRMAVEALGRIGLPAVPVLIAALKNNDDDVRRMAAEALGRIGPEAKAAVPALILALKDDNYFVRGGSADALGRIGPEAKAAVPDLIKALKNEQLGDWQKAVIKALNSIANFDSISEIVNSLKESKEVWNNKIKIFLWEKFISLVIFRKPEALTIDLFGNLSLLFQAERTWKYFLYYTSIQPRAPPQVITAAEGIIKDKTIFTKHNEIRSQLKAGRKRVLAVQNIGDGQGDELIRMYTLLQAMLDYNSELKITIVTKRGYLYDHPRVTVIPIDNFNGYLLNGHYDVVINHFDSNYGINREAATKLNRYMNSLVNQSSPPAIIIKTNKSSDDFYYQKLVINRQDQGDTLIPEINYRREGNNNVYESTFRLLAELGIPFRFGYREKNREGHLLVGAPYQNADTKWSELMQELNNVNSDRKEEALPVVILNPFGGESENKGYLLQEKEALKADINKLINKGFAVIILPNGRDWGTKKYAKEIISEIEGKVVVGPDQSEDARLLKYLAAYADGVITVEGGMMHLGYCLGKPIEIILKPGAGPEKWLPMGLGNCQKVFNSAQHIGEGIRPEAKIDNSETRPGKEIKSFYSGVNAFSGNGFGSSAWITGLLRGAISSLPELAATKTGGISFREDTLEITCAQSVFPAGQSIELYPELSLGLHCNLEEIFVLKEPAQIYN